MTQRPGPLSLYLNASASLTGETLTASPGERTVYMPVYYTGTRPVGSLLLHDTPDMIHHVWFRLEAENDELGKTVMLEILCS